MHDTANSYLHGVFAKIRLFLKIYLSSAKKSKLPSHQVFGVFALLEVNKILQATPSKLRREMGMCATDYNIYAQQQQYYTIRVQYTVLVLYVLQSRASRSRCSIPGAWYGTCKHPTDYTNQRYGGLSRA